MKEFVLQCINAFLMLCAVIAALFGEQLQKCFFGPKIKVSLNNNIGELNTTNEGAETWFYHLIVTNKGKTAERVTVFLVKLENNIEGNKEVVWENEVPFRWVYQEVYTNITRNVLKSEKCDLMSVNKDGLHLQTLFTPNNLKNNWNGPCDFYLKAYAKGDNSISDYVSIHVVWDGKWSLNSYEMQEHLIINSQ